jgi:hypothetical protein
VRRRKLHNKQKRMISSFLLRLQLTLMLEAAGKLALILEIVKSKQITELVKSDCKSNDSALAEGYSKAIELDGSILVELPSETEQSAVLVELPGQEIAMATIEDKPPIPPVDSSERGLPRAILEGSSGSQSNRGSKSSRFSFLNIIPTPSEYRSKRKAITESIYTFLKQTPDTFTPAMSFSTRSMSNANHRQNLSESIKGSSIRQCPVLPKDKVLQTIGPNDQSQCVDTHSVEVSPAEWRSDIVMSTLRTTMVSDTGSRVNFSISRLSPVSSISSSSCTHTGSPGNGHGAAELTLESWKAWKRQFLHSLINDVHSLMGDKSASCTSCTSSHHSSQYSATSGAGSICENSVSPRPRKRFKNGPESSNIGEEDEVEDSEDDRDGDKGKSKTSINTSDAKQRKFACPYYQRNPELHTQYRSCAGPGWTSIHRLK